MRSTQPQAQTDYPSAFAIQVAAMVDTIEEPEQAHHQERAWRRWQGARFEPNLIRQF
ncbi:hypothetical protein [Chroococcidiopsis sp [FACHB-1243]]|uniref:hypothetical protein n=1 Tax=Chroococcidiopsis sp. [FACHB-1243] TaxID=2692781 RepID=UPI0018EF8AA4|nr:hypothetical protein [Chroococcidiopsis sp. [FACHB-1243]]